MSARVERRDQLRAGTPARRRRRWFLPVYSGVVIGYLFLPIAVMILYGFNDSRGRFLSFSWQGFTLRWYRDLFSIPE
ncbi:MAG TPA: ABC transporter permease, partial [Actinomycetota bacterium]|nr:ABC transporter permease [Actinomycetota bacterium]